MEICDSMLLLREYIMFDMVARYNIEREREREICQYGSSIDSIWYDEYSKWDRQLRDVMPISYFYRYMMKEIWSI